MNYLKYMLQKSWDRVKHRKKDVLFGAFVALLSLFSFAFGYLTAMEDLKEPIEINQNE